MPELKSIQPSKSPPRHTFFLGSRPEFTGTRILGFFLVVIAHNARSWEFGFWNIMNYWFGLSGFLITAGLIGELNKTGKINGRYYYARRVLRLFPPTFTVIVLVCIYGLITHAPNFSSVYLQPGISTIFFYGNYYYLSHFLSLDIFSQMWSTSVDEHFYVFWMIVLYTCTKYFNKDLLFKIAIFLSILADLDRFASFYVFHFTERTYYTFDPRGADFLCGALVVLVAERYYEKFFNKNSKPATWFKVASFISFLFLLYTLFFVKSLDFTQGFIWAGTFLDFAVFFILGYLYLNPNSVPSRILRNNIIVHFGNLNLSLYVWFWPIDILVNPSNTHLGLWPLFFLRLFIMIILSEITYWSIEIPMKHLRKGRFTVKELRDPNFRPI